MISKIYYKFTYFYTSKTGRALIFFQQSALKSKKKKKNHYHKSIYMYLRLYYTPCMWLESHTLLWYWVATISIWLNYTPRYVTESHPLPCEPHPSFHGYDRVLVVTSKSGIPWLLRFHAWVTSHFFFIGCRVSTVRNSSFVSEVTTQGYTVKMKLDL